jgi:hypothetical protein
MVPSGRESRTAMATPLALLQAALFECAPDNTKVPCLCESRKGLLGVEHDSVQPTNGEYDSLSRTREAVQHMLVASPLARPSIQAGPDVTHIGPVGTHTFGDLMSNTITLQFSHDDWTEIFTSGVRRQSTRDVMEALRHGKVVDVNGVADMNCPYRPHNDHPRVGSDGDDRVLLTWFGTIRYRRSQRHKLAAYLRNVVDVVEKAQ